MNCIRRSTLALAALTLTTLALPAVAQDAWPNKPVKLVVLLASPPDRTSDHIQALARVSRLITMEDFREKIYAAETGAQIWELLKEEEANR